MFRFLKVMLLAAGVVLATVIAVFLVGMRRKSPAVIDAVRRFNAAVSNPKQMETAGTPGAYASIIEHSGRTSGTVYRTPIGTQATDDGFLIALPYGTRPDWVKNVLAAGSAVITADGETVAVDRPEIMPVAQVAHQIPGNEQWLMRLFNVEQFMTVRRAAGEAAVAEPTDD